MRYLTDIYALNIPDDTLCTGDWHRGAMVWADAERHFRDTETSIFGDYGIRTADVPEIGRKGIPVANVIRAILDLMDNDEIITDYRTGRPTNVNIRWLRNFRDDFICCEEYDHELFERVALLKGKVYWDELNDLMKYEYMDKWDRWCLENNV